MSNAADPNAAVTVAESNETPHMTVAATTAVSSYDSNTPNPQHQKNKIEGNADNIFYDCPDRNVERCRSDPTPNEAAAASATAALEVVSNTTAENPNNPTKTATNDNVISIEGVDLKVHNIMYTTEAAVAVALSNSHHESEHRTESSTKSKQSNKNQDKHRDGGYSSDCGNNKQSYI